MAAAQRNSGELKRTTETTTGKRRKKYRRRGGVVKCHLRNTCETVNQGRLTAQTQPHPRRKGASHALIDRTQHRTLQPSFLSIKQAISYEPAISIELARTTSVHPVAERIDHLIADRVH